MQLDPGRQVRLMNWRVGVALVAMFAVINISGCGVYKKWQLNKQVKRVEQLLAEAQQAEAPRYSYDDYNAAQTALNTAKQQITDNNLAEAETRLEESERRVVMAIDNVEARRAVVDGKRRVLEETQGRLREVYEQALAANAPTTAADAFERANTARTEWEGRQGQVVAQREQRPEAYDEVTLEGEQVLQLLQESFNLALQPEARRFDDLIRETEERLLEIEIRRFSPEEFAALQDRLNVFRGKMDNDLYAEAYELGRPLAAEMEALEAQGRRARARGYLDEANRAIESARERGAREYAIDPLNLAIQAYNGADEAFERDDFDGAYEQAVESANHVQTAIAAIQDRAGAEIDDVKVALDRAREDEVDIYAPGTAETAQFRLNEAQLFFVEGDFLRALELSKEARELIQRAIQEARRARAQEAIGQIQATIDRARAQGAAEYALGPLNEVEAEVGAIRQRFDVEDYQEVVPMSRQAQETAERLMDALGEAADQRVIEAAKVVEQARLAQAERHADTQMRAAVATLADASSAVARGELRRGFDLSAQAETTARQASDQSFRLRTESTLSRVRDELDLAVRAGAREHTPDLFVEAVDAQNRAQQGLRTQAYQDALDAATTALDAAEGARLSKLRRAQAYTDGALEAGARQYDPEPMERALERLAVAKDAMRVNNFELSNREADEAYTYARRAYDSTWRQRSDALLAEVRPRANRGRTNLGATKSPDIFSAAARYLAQAEGAYVSGVYDDAYVNADLANQSLSSLEADLARIAGEELDEINRELLAIKALGVDDTVRERLAPRYDRHAAATVAAQQGDFLTAFNTAESLRADLNMDTRFSLDHQIATRIGGIDDLLNEYIAMGAHNLAPERFEEFQRRRNTLATTKILDASFEDALIDIAQLRGAIIEVETEIRTSVAERIATMESQIEEARREEGNVYYPDKFAAALDGFTAMRNLPRGRNYQEIYETLTTAEDAVSGVLNQSIIGRQERTYKYEVQDRVKEMNDILNRFEGITLVDKRAWATAMRGPEKTGHGANISPYKAGQMQLTDRNLLVLSTDLRRRVREIKPPSTLESLHVDVLALFDKLVESAENFQRVGDSASYNREARLLFLDRAYATHEQLSQMNAEIQGKLQVRDPFEFRIETELSWTERLDRWFWQW